MEPISLCKPFDRIPNEVLLHTLSFLDQRSLLVTKQISKRFQILSDENLENIRIRNLKRECSLKMIPVFDRMEPDEWKKGEFLEKYRDRIHYISFVSIHPKNFTSSFLEFLEINAPFLCEVFLCECPRSEPLTSLPKSVTCLQMSDGSLTEEIARSLSTHLTRFSYSGKDTITSKNLNALTNLKSLAIRGQDINSLPDNLTHLDLCLNSKITNKTLTNLPPNLLKLDVSCCRKINNKGLKNLPSRLTSLNISAIDAFTEEIFSSFPDCLAELDLTGCKQITGEKFDLLPRNLQRLALVRCVSLESQNFRKFRSPLTHLDLTGCQHLNDECAPLIPRTVFHLNLWGTQITDNCFQSLPKKIRTLSLGYCLKITDNGLKELPKTLERLNLYHCTQLTDRVVENLLTLPWLTSLNMTKCSGITETSLKLLPKTLKLHNF